MRTKYDLAGTTIELRWSTRAIAPAVRAVFEHLGLRSSSSQQRAQPVVVALSTANPAPSVPAQAEQITTFDTGLTAHRDGTRIFLRSPCAADRLAVARLAPARGTGCLQIAPRALEDSQALRGTLFGMLATSLSVLLRHRQRYPLHAAALAGHDTSVLLVANQDCGKSTLAYSLARQGWSFLSDDSVLLHPKGAAVEAVAFRKRFTMDAEAREAFPEIRPHWKPLFGSETKGAVFMDRLYPDQAAERCVPDVLVFPQIADRPDSQLRPVRKAEALHRVLGQSALLTLQPDLAPQHVEAARRLVNQTRHYQLVAGRDARDDPPRVARLLEKTRRDAPSLSASA